MLPHSLVVGKEEKFVLDNRAGEVAAELIQLEGLLGFAGLMLEEVAGIQNLIAEKIECFAMELISPRLSDEINHRTKRAAVLSLIAGIEDIDLLNTIYAGSGDPAFLTTFGIRCAVDIDSRGIRAVQKHVQSGEGRLHAVYAALETRPRGSNRSRCHFQKVH